MSVTQAATETRLTVDIWSDVMCPFCYMGDALFDQALAQFRHADRVDVRYHSYLLMPDLTATEPIDRHRLIFETKGIRPEQLDSMNQQIVARGRMVGLDYRYDRLKTVGTRRAHQLGQYAATEGRQHIMMQRLFKAFFSDGLNVADINTLGDLAAEVGLDRNAAVTALETRAFESAVEADVAQARQSGIQGVPLFVIAGKYGVSGAQPVEVFLRALEQGWEDINPSTTAS